MTSTTGRRRQGEGGLVTLEFVLIAPALLLAIFASVQFALWYHAGQVARAAASEGAQAGAVVGGSPGQASAKAGQVVAAVGRGVVLGPSVQADQAGGQVRVTVSGSAPSIVLGWRLPVHATAVAPVEAFHPETAAP